MYFCLSCISGFLKIELLSSQNRPSSLSPTSNYLHFCIQKLVVYFSFLYTKFIFPQHVIFSWWFLRWINFSCIFISVSKVRNLLNIFEDFRFFGKSIFFQKFKNGPAASGGSQIQQWTGRFQQKKKTKNWIKSIFEKKEYNQNLLCQVSLEFFFERFELGSG